MKKIYSDLNFWHHEESPAHKLTMTIRELGNPFLEQSPDALVLLHNGQMHEEIGITDLGRDLYEEFIVKRLQQQNIPLSQPIKQNKLSIFSTSPTKTKKQQNVDAMRNDIALLLRLFIGCQNRDGDLQNFFSHEKVDLFKYFKKNHE